MAPRLRPACTRPGADHSPAGHHAMVLVPRAGAEGPASFWATFTGLCGRKSGPAVEPGPTPAPPGPLQPRRDGRSSRCRERGDRHRGSSCWAPQGGMGAASRVLPAAGSPGCDIVPIDGGAQRQLAPFASTRILSFALSRRRDSSDAALVRNFRWSGRPKRRRAREGGWWGILA